jgi:predicted secreted protein
MAFGKNELAAFQGTRAYCAPSLAPETMNRFFSRSLALSLFVAPLALVARAQTPTATLQPTVRRAKTPKPKRTPRPKATPTPVRPQIPVSASDANNGKTIFVARTGIIELRLASNPSTGYGWSVVSNRNLKLEGEPSYEATPVAPDVVGSGGFSVFRFRALKEGQGDLALDLRSPGFKTGDKAAREFRAVVRVLK